MNLSDVEGSNADDIQLYLSAGNLPSISRVIDAIQKKKTRDNAIVGLIIAGCICFTIWYLV